MSTGRDGNRKDRRHSPWCGFWLAVAAGFVVWLFLLWIIANPVVDCCR